MNLDTEYANALPVLSQDEVYDLAKRSFQGDLAAREELILGHMYVAKKIAREFSNNGVPYDDLFQEGCYGLFLAAEKYDYRYGTSFSTYAGPFVKKYVQQALITQNDNLPIVPKEHTYYTMQKFHAAYRELKTTLDRPPTVNELAEKLGCTQRLVEKMMQRCYSFVSKDAPIPTGEGRANKDLHVELTNPREQMSVEDEVIESMHILDLSSYNVSLTNREKQALSLHLGFTPDGKPKSYQEMASITGLSLETLRRDYLSAIKKIKESVEN